MGFLTEHVPKPLLQVGGKPLIVRLIEQLRRANFRDLVINLAYRGEQIQAPWKQVAASSLPYRGSARRRFWSLMVMYGRSSHSPGLL
jgi:GTP:adenosylcobinamide-phosphate guanylyltransferase